MTAKKKPSPPVESPAESDWSGMLLEVLVSHAKPATASEVVHLTGLPLPQATAMLDDLVSEGVVSLSDDGCYAPIEPSTPEADGAEAAADHHDLTEEAVGTPDVTVECRFDDTSDPVDFEGKGHVVLLPTSDLLRFLTTINLPPRLIAGLGTLSELKGVLSYEPVEATPDDPHPIRKFHVRISGRHVGHFAALNPNQPGYVSEGVSLTSFVEAPE